MGLCGGGFSPWIRDSPLRAFYHLANASTTPLLLHAMIAVVIPMIVSRVGRQLMLAEKSRSRGQQMKTREMSIEMMSGPSIIYQNLMSLTTSPRDVFRIILCCLWSLILIDLVRRFICFLSFIHGSLLIFSSNECLILNYTFLISDGQRRSLVARHRSLEPVLQTGFSSHRRCGDERDLSEITRCVPKLVVPVA